jgi:glycosyltransferase involved in cell wall biosynthesis
MSTNDIRVLHTEWSDGWGGQEIRIINEMKTLRDKNIVVYLACRDHALIKQKAVENNIKVFVLPFNGNADLISLFKLIRIIKKNSINIVNTHSGKDTWIGGLSAKLTGIKFIRTRHLSNPIKASRLNFINELADYIFTTGEIVKSNMINTNRIKPEQIQSVPTGIDASLFDPARFNQSDCKKLFSINNNDIAVGIVAVLRQFKRHDLFLKMAKVIIQRFPDKNFIFLIAGDGPQKKNIISWIDELGLTKNVRLLGHVNQVAELFSALDLVVLSSDSKEGVPQSVMQALMMNKAVVSTNSGSTNDLFNNNNFQLVETSSVEALASGVVHFLENEKEVHSREYVKSNFSLEVMSRKIVSVYEELLS